MLQNVCHTVYFENDSAKFYVDQKETEKIKDGIIWAATILQGE
jgi:hypothetical protein